MRVEAFIPFADESCRERYRSVALIVDYFRDNFSEWEPAIVDGPLDFPRALVCNAAARNSTADVIVFNDADSLVEPVQLAEAVELAAGYAMVRAYTVYRRISEEGSAKCETWQQVLDSDDIVWEQPNTASHGVLAISRQAFLDVGGYDPRFHYFYDDLSFDIRAADKVAQHRIEGTLQHLWHPAREPWPDDELLWERYKTEDPVLVRGEVGW